MTTIYRLTPGEKQDVTLTGRNRTVPPCSLGRRTGYAPGPAAARRVAGRVTDDDR